MQSIKLSAFTRDLFDSTELARQGARILEAVLEAQSPRLSEIARHMAGKPDSNYKRLQRFLAQVDLLDVLGRLFQHTAEFVIGDVTEIPRPHARKTAYVGTLKDGKTRGFWLLTLATPFRGRAIPFQFVSYSSQTIAQQATSRNQEHSRVLAPVHELIGDKPVVLDREFSYQELLEQFTATGVHFVIRLNLGSHPPLFYDEQGRRLELSVARGETLSYTGVSYRGQVRVNLIGTWQSGFHEPLWVISDLSPQRALALYLQRMHIEQTFRDLKSLLHLDQLMNKQQAHMEQTVALLLLAYGLGVLIGERLRDAWASPGTARRTTHARRVARALATAARHKWQRYSGLFVLLKLPLGWPAQRFKRLLRQTATDFRALLFPPVPSLV